MLRPTEFSRALCSVPSALPGQVVLVLQGGGALGSYQAGVYQALHEAGIEPDWIVGTSIGAINASLIAGNASQDRLPFRPGTSTGAISSANFPAVCAAEKRRCERSAHSSWAARLI